MVQVSIDMSINDETAGNRIFGEVIDVQGNTLLCEYTGTNYDFNNATKIGDLLIKLRIAEEALENIESNRFSYIDELNCVNTKSATQKELRDIARKALKKIKEQPNTKQEMKTTCDICGKEIIGIDNFIDAGDKVVCSKKCLETAISEFYHWQNTKG